MPRQHSVPRITASVTCPVTKLEKALLVRCSTASSLSAAFWGRARRSSRLDWARSVSFCASIYRENTSASRMFTSAPTMEEVMFRVVFTTLSPRSCKKPVMVSRTCSALRVSSGSVTPWLSAKSLRLFHHA